MRMRTGPRARDRVFKMRPYFQNEKTIIYHGDSLEILGALAGDLSGEVSAVVMDPPYASGGRKEAGKKTSGAMVRGGAWKERPIKNDQMTTIGFVFLLRSIVLRCSPLLVDGGAVLSFIDWRNWPNLVGVLETCDLRVNGMVVWDKSSMGLGNGFRNQHELVAFASKGSPNIFHRGTPNVLDVKRDRRKDHPSPKPVELMDKIIRVVTGEGGLVLDPFMGSGATLEAAQKRGAFSIGIEMEEEFCEIAAKRLDGE